MNRSLVGLLVALIAIALTVPGFTSQQTDRVVRNITTPTSNADRLYEEGSYRLAHEAYEAIALAELDENDRLWIRFRRADSLWRSEAADPSIDPSRVERARKDLAELLRLYEDGRERDQLFALIHESLGDSHWNQFERNWAAAWSHYAIALEWWAGSEELDLARERYLGMVRKASESPQAQPWEHRGQYAQSIPFAILENAVEISSSPGDVAYMNYLLALATRHATEPRLVERGSSAFETAIEQGRGTDWYDDALFAYAETLAQRGRLLFRDGRWQRIPDPAGALVLYRRLISEFAKGQTRYYDQAIQRIREITEPHIGVTVSNIFLPGSKIGYWLQWRNVSSAEIELWQIDLTRDQRFGSAGTNEWISRLSLDQAKRVESKTRQLTSDGPHMPGNEMVKLDRELPIGAYLLRVRAAGKEARELILVTDIAIVTKSSPSQILAFVTDARSGKPVSGADVRIWEEIHDGTVRHRDYRAKTDANGVAVVERIGDHRGRQIYAATRTGDRQAFASGWSWSGPTSDASWRIYAATDRPAYRPGETAHWKITARLLSETGYSTPAGEQVRYQIHDSRGNKVSEGALNLNSFGSAWSDLELDETMPLGVYSVQFLTSDGSGIGSAQLFRLEEYKLPEFRVTVSPADDDDGSPKLHRLGDQVEVEIGAEYYFGGPVANASVQVVVHQKPYHPIWQWPRPHGWYFEPPRHRGWYGPGQEVLNQTLITGPDGRVTFTFDTPDQGQDLEYTIEARVTDASRREIRGSATVRVTSQPFYAHMKPRHVLHRPGDRIEIDLRTVDANDRPVAADGELVVTRDTWKEVWLDPKGRKLSGSELDAVRSRSALFPPPQEPEQHPWTLISRGYEHEEIARLSLDTNEKGEATYRFEARREGFYRVRWTSEVVDETTVRPRDVVQTETTIWVADRQTRALGYHSSGVELIIDADSFRAGSVSPVMIVTESAGSHVLFTVEREEIFEHRVIETRGNVTLLELEITDRDIPNVFLAATMVRDLRLETDTKQIMVPPVQHFLEVTIETDQSEYQPRDPGRVTVTTRDHEGQPVQAEVSLAVADESVYYIQDDLAGDPRQFFYSDKRPNAVQTTSSFQQKSYVRLAETEGGNLIDERQLAGKKRKDEAEGVASGAVSGVVGGVADSASRQAMAESISVAAAPPPAPVTPPAAMKASMDRDESGATPPGDAVIVRSDFRSTAFWQPDIVTGSDGTATVQLSYPDSLTTWRATARAATTGADFGIATTETVTRKPLIVRLQAPRFFVVGDEAVVSAIINNNTDRPLSVTPGIEIAGLEILGSFVEGQRTTAHRNPVAIEAGGESRVEWLVAARQAGTATMRVQGSDGALSDAMERSYTVWEHGIEKLIVSSGKVHGDDSTIRVDLPHERRSGSTMMSVQVTSSVAITMLDAIPYLIQYPYGCTEQTMSRFLPAAIVMKTLEELGISRAMVASHIFGGIEPESADAVHPKGRTDLEKLDEVTAKGLARLYDFQHADGGWGWWKEGESDHFMTAYVVWGLKLASDGGVAVRSGVIERAVSWLDLELVEEENDPNRQAWMLHAVTAAQPGRTNENRVRAFTNLWTKRDALTAYGRALLALSAHALGKSGEAETLVRNLENGVTFDASPDQSALLEGRASRTEDVMATAHWGSDRFWWRWYDGPVETTAFVLRALVAIDPDHRLVEPTMNWLVRNRRGAQWNNTRDSAISILALNDYLRQSGELKGSASYSVTVNGIDIGTGTFDPSSILTARTRFNVPSSAIRDGRNEVRVARSRPADSAEAARPSAPSLYFSVEANYFSTEEPIPAEGNEIFVKREYYRLVPRETLLKGFTYERVPLRDGESIRSGERVDVVLTVETKNDYEYLLFEDLKPAGLEAVEVRSGESLFATQLRSDAVARRFEDQSAAKRRGRVIESTEATGRTERVHQELRDRKVVMFADQLSQGVWEIRYELRAEVPGSFHALPLIGEAMYVPEIRANSDEIRVTVED